MNPITDWFFKKIMNTGVALASAKFAEAIAKGDRAR